MTECMIRTMNTKLWRYDYGVALVASSLLWLKDSWSSSTARVLFFSPPLPLSLRRTLKRHEHGGIKFQQGRLFWFSLIIMTIHYSFELLLCLLS